MHCFFVVCAGYQSHPGQDMLEDQYHHATPMDIEPNDDKGMLSDKIETIDYSHGRVGSSVQSVDYHHGQGGGGSSDHSHLMGGMGSAYDSPVPSLAVSAEHSPSVYGGYPSYQGYEGYSSGNVGGMPFQGQGSSFFSGLDPAAIFAAYTEQTGMCRIIGTIFFSKCN